MLYCNSNIINHTVLLLTKYENIAKAVFDKGDINVTLIISRAKRDWRRSAIAFYQRVARASDTKNVLRFVECIKRLTKYTYKELKTYSEDL